MPELPEVETIRRGLKPVLVGQVITDVETIWPKSVHATTPELMNTIINQPVLDCRRRAKVLIIDLANGQSLLFHLKMTGQLVLVKATGGRMAGGHPTASMAARLPDSSTRAILTLGSGDQLFFNDQRKFGWIKLIPTEKLTEDLLIARMGPEPLTSDFSVNWLTTAIARHPKAPIKAIILDQSSVAGLGNIYADESLHLAKIHPARLGASLKPTEIKRLHAAIRQILQLGVEHGGTSFTHYVNALGQRGDYLEQARVFRRQGQPCPVCGTSIQKIRLVGRGTHLCPRCQPVAKALK